MSSLPRSRILEVEDVGTVAIARFGDAGMGSWYHGEFHELREDLPWLVDELGRHRVLLDFTGVELFDSRSLGAFIKLHRMIQLAQGILVLCNLPSAARDLFSITRLDRLITISPLLGHIGRTKILHEQFGVAFRPEPFSPEWRTRTVAQVAQRMVESRDFAAMPLLADALEDAGCDNTDVLDHCRGSGLHTGWCPVLELALGKE